MASGIATLVCYAGVFNDVISVEETATRLGLPQDGKFHATLADLHQQGRLVIRDGFVCLPNLGDKIAVKAAKVKLARHMIASGTRDLMRLGRHPLVKFVGISGSLAAENPTEDKDGLVDIDVFLITRNQCIWLFEIPKRIHQNLFPKAQTDSSLCINYVMDESDLLVENRNLFTATEIRNLIPVTGLPVFRRFLQVNSWIDYYYPGFTGYTQDQTPARSWNLVNKCLYVLVVLLYCVKYCSLGHLRKFVFTAIGPNGTKFNRVSPVCGGYQIAIHRKFTRLAALWFADLIDEKLIEKLFPDELSQKIRRDATDSLKSECDFSKYGSQPILSKSG